MLRNEAHLRLKCTPLYLFYVIVTIGLIDLNSLEAINSPLTYSNLIVDPPKELMVPLNVPHKLMMAGGPSNCYPKDVQASTKSVLGPDHPELHKIMDDVRLGIQYLFQTKNKWTMALSGSGNVGMEALLFNLLQPGETVLVGVNGFWSERIVEMTNRIGSVAAIMEVEPGTAFGLKQIENGLKLYTPQVLYLVHSESSTGVMQPLEGVGDLCRRYGCLLVVDAIASMGGVPFYMDEWKVDALITVSYKILGAPPGLVPISFGPRAIKKIKSRTSPIKSFVYDANLMCAYWACNNEKGDDRIYHYTPTINTMYALREALAIICKEGLPSLWERHAKNSQRLQQGVKAIGLEYYVPKPEFRLPTSTSVKIPEGIDGKVVIQYAVDMYLVEIGSGFGPTEGKTFRLGVMGYNAMPHKVDRLLRALRESLEFAGFRKRISSNATINYSEI